MSEFELREQEARVRPGKTMIKGVMASRGRWSAWGADAGQASEALRKMLWAVGARW